MLSELPQLCALICDLGGMTIYRNSDRNASDGRYLELVNLHSHGHYDVHACNTHETACCL